MSNAILLVFAAIGAVAAAAGAGTLLARCFRAPRADLIAWSVALLGLLVSLGAQLLGYLAGYDAAIFRAMAIGGLVIAPLAVILGLTEVASKGLAARFCARLYIPALAIVAVVILVLDQLGSATFTKSWPNPHAYYQSPPNYMLYAVSVVTVIIAAIAVGIVMARSGRPGLEPGQHPARRGRAWPPCCWPTRGLPCWPGTRPSRACRSHGLHPAARDRGGPALLVRPEAQRSGRHRAARPWWQRRGGGARPRRCGARRASAPDGAGPAVGTRPTRPSDFGRYDGRDEYDDRYRPEPVPERPRQGQPHPDDDAYEYGWDHARPARRRLGRGLPAAGDRDRSYAGEYTDDGYGQDGVRGRGLPRPATSRPAISRPATSRPADCSRPATTRRARVRRACPAAARPPRATSPARTCSARSRSTRCSRTGSRVRPAHRAGGRGCPRPRAGHAGVHRARGPVRADAAHPVRGLPRPGRLRVAPAAAVCGPFESDRRPYVLATNVIELGLQQAKVSPFPSVAELFGEPGYDTSGFERPDYLRDYGRPSASHGDARGFGRWSGGLRGVSTPGASAADRVLLLSRPGCHLCDEARTVIDRVPPTSASPGPSVTSPAAPATWPLLGHDPGHVRRRRAARLLAGERGAAAGGPARLSGTPARSHTWRIPA